jgi:hypothetical protein
MVAGNLLGRHLLALFSNLLVQLFHFLMGILILQCLAQNIGYIRRPNAQSRHGADGLQGLQGQRGLFRLILRLLPVPDLQLGLYRFHILGSHPRRQTVSNGLGHGSGLFFIVGQGFGHSVCRCLAALHGFHGGNNVLFSGLLSHAFQGFAHYRPSGQPCLGSRRNHLLGAHSVLFLEPILNHQRQHFPGLSFGYAQNTQFPGLLFYAFHGLL